MLQADGRTLQAKVFFGQQAAENGLCLPIRAYFERMTAVDGPLEILDEGNAGRTRFNMVAHALTALRLQLAVQIFREIREDLAALGWRLRRCFLPTRRGRPSLQELCHLLAHEQACPMQPNAHGSGLDGEDLRHQIRIELLHIVKHQNDPVLRRQSQDGLVEQAMILAAPGRVLRARGRIGQQQGFQLRVVGQELIEGDRLPIRRGSASLPAAILRGGVEPGRKRPRIFELRQMGQGLDKDFLRGVFGVLAMATDFESEGEHGALEQPDGAVDAGGVTASQKGNRFCKS